ncbi:unnamed protein product [Acanthosepion pharaonis]|uniref:Uncharacterized protein n=1 Tax=Acanthosepion pharaonis TaxID=158019 RepID=A0A812ANL4_ACAPH|nr:unnamed protein product [Sepia pharaonis]
MFFYSFFLFHPLCFFTLSFFFILSVFLLFLSFSSSLFSYPFFLFHSRFTLFSNSFFLFIRSVCLKFLFSFSLSLSFFLSFFSILFVFLLFLFPLLDKLCLALIACRSFFLGCNSSTNAFTPFSDLIGQMPFTPLARLHLHFSRTDGRYLTRRRPPESS